MKINAITMTGKTLTISFDDTVNDKQPITHTIKTKEEPHNDFVNAFGKLKKFAIDIMNIDGRSEKTTVPIKLKIKYEKFFYYFSIIVTKSNDLGTSILQTPKVASNSKFCDNNPDVKKVIDEILQETRLFIESNKRGSSQDSLFAPAVTVQSPESFGSQGIVQNGKLEIPINNNLAMSESKELINQLEDEFNEVNGITDEFDIEETEILATAIPDSVIDDAFNADDFFEDEKEEDFNQVPTAKAKSNKVKNITTKAKAKINSKKKK